MHPSEIRRRILDEHETLRAILLTVEARARDVLQGGESVRPLRVEGETLHERLLSHMHWEDVHLAPALRAADSWGREREAQLAADHREQRELLQHTLAGIRDASRPSVTLARTMIDLIALLREDMDHEEATLLDPRVLRDDVVGIDVEAG